MSLIVYKEKHATRKSFLDNKYVNDLLYNDEYTNIGIVYKLNDDKVIHKKYVKTKNNSSSFNDTVRNTIKFVLADEVELVISFSSKDDIDFESGTRIGEQFSAGERDTDPIVFSDNGSIFLSGRGDKSIFGLSTDITYISEKIKTREGFGEYLNLFLTKDAMIDFSTSRTLSISKNSNYAISEMLMSILTKYSTPVELHSFINEDEFIKNSPFLSFIAKTSIPAVLNNNDNIKILNKDSFYLASDGIYISSISTPPTEYGILNKKKDSYISGLSAKELHMNQMIINQKIIVYLDGVAYMNGKGVEYADDLLALEEVNGTDLEWLYLKDIINNDKGLFGNVYFTDVL